MESSEAAIVEPTPTKIKSKKIQQTTEDSSTESNFGSNSTQSKLKSSTKSSLKVKNNSQEEVADASELAPIAPVKKAKSSKKTDEQNHSTEEDSEETAVAVSTTTEKPKKSVAKTVTKFVGTMNDDFSSSDSSAQTTTGTKKISSKTIATTTGSQGRQRSSTTTHIQSLRTSALDESTKTFSKDDSETTIKKKKRLSTSSTEEQQPVISLKKKRSSTVGTIKLKSRDDILQDRAQFSKNISKGATNLKLSTAQQSNADIMKVIATKQEDFGKQMTNQTQQLNSSVSQLGNVFQQKRKETQEMMSQLAEKTSTIKPEKGEMDADEPAEELAKKIRQKWDIEKRKADEFNKSWKGFVVRNYKWFAIFGGIILLILLYFFWAWIWGLISSLWRSSPKTEL